MDNQEKLVTPGIRIEMPLLPLRGMTAFPGMLLSFDVERPFSVAALNAAMNGERLIFLTTQKDITTETPDTTDLYQVGVVCRMRQQLRIPGGHTARAMVQGISRGRIVNARMENDFIRAEIEVLSDVETRHGKAKVEALLRQSAALFDQYAHLSGNITPETLVHVVGASDPGYLADYITQNIFLRFANKQLVLEELRPVSRLQLVNRLLTHEIGVLKVSRDLQESTQNQINQNHRDFYLREQLKTIQAELGEEEDPQSEMDAYRDKIRSLGFDSDTETKLLKEVTRLSKQPFGSSEAAVLRTYLDIVTELPWKRMTKETIDIAKAKRILDADHYGLDKVKDRILEFLAVKQLTPDVKGGVICLVGPPGVGKTSVAMSLARAMNRKLARISLGGVHDESEIRGHRKTYVGAMPGRIIAAIQQANSRNPVLVLDEIDKLGSDYRGDPSAALLEALDTEQNSTFRDHYLEIPFDLSDTLFITTANTTDTIPRALLDRMEVITLDSYTDEEKLQIAKKHLLPKQRKKHGLTAKQLRVSDDAIREVITNYTRESGVRVLERELAQICRRTARAVAEDPKTVVSLRTGMLEPYLGVPRYKENYGSDRDEVGLVRGLAWTSVGGEILEVEVGVMEGTGKIELTGNLGDVMKESAKAGMSYVRSRARQLGIDPDFYKTKDIHIHFPEGAVPKDGPSAGITMCVGLISALTGIPVRRDLAMTGEISLRGRILPIGGLKEKTMAALRAGVHTVIIPAENEKDLEEIDQTVRRELKFVTAEHVDDILEVALTRLPSPLPEAQTFSDGDSELPVPQPVPKLGPSLRQ
ncbi:MAG: endopeptidase La [Oscillospiraceae bacterium]|nr:endopeptidase La [Oscillospiraceae bacterium]